MNFFRSSNFDDVTLRFPQHFYEFRRDKWKECRSTDECSISLSAAELPGENVTFVCIDAIEINLNEIGIWNKYFSIFESFSTDQMIFQMFRSL